MILEFQKISNKQNSNFSIIFLIYLNFCKLCGFFFRDDHEKRDYALELIKSSYFEDKDIEQIFEIFIYYDGKLEPEKKVFQKKNYRKEKPKWIGETKKKTIEKQVQERNMISIN